LSSNRLQLAVWSKKDEIGFVFENNVYFYDMKTVKQITFHGNSFIFNGVTDWVYEGNFKIIKI